MNPSLPTLIEDLVTGSDVDAGALAAAFDRILRGDEDPARTAGLLVALRSRRTDGATLALLASALRRHSPRVPGTARPRLDTCGTGGDGAGTFNLSTAAALVAAAAGGIVAKHGNRSISSRTGSADVLEASGLPVDLGAEACGRLLDATGFAFLYAPAFHPALRRVQAVRKTLGVRTLFNLVGPLANPALPEFQVVGVASPGLTEPMTAALQLLGTRGALVVHCAGVDELGLHAPSRGHRLHEGRIEPFELDPRELGLSRAPVEALAGGDAAENATRLRAVLSGEPGPIADAVALNAAAACAVAGLAPSIAAGLEEVRSILTRGAAERVLVRVLETAQRLRADEDRDPPAFGVAR